MSRYCHNTPEVKNTKRLLFKNNQFEVKTSKISGTVTIKGWRKYNYHNEVDLMFQGEIKVQYERKSQWIDSTFLTRKNVSLIKCNKIIRRMIWKELKDYLSYFAIALNRGQFVIKKVKWI